MDDERLKKLAAQWAEDTPPRQPFVPPGTAISAAILTVLTQRLGVEFARDVREELFRQADKMASSEDEQDRFDAPACRDIAGWPMWRRLGAVD